MKRKITLTVFLLITFFAKAQQFTFNTNAGDYTNIGLKQAGACMLDYNNDGFVDIIASGYDSATENNTQVYLNNRDKTFSALSTSDLYMVNTGGPLLISGDYDNDGDFDIYKLNFQNSSGSPINNVLYENSGETNFELTQTTLVGNTGEENKSDSGTWVDYDLDGDLDLYSTGAGGSSDLFYRNDGGSFTQIFGLAFFQSRPWPIVTDTWFDFDGDLDVYFANFQNNNNRLYLSQFIETGNPDNFLESVVDGITNNAGNNIGCNWVDYDNDLDLDLFLNTFNGQDQLYANNGDMTFTEVIGQPMLQNSAWTTINSWADYDNDGDLDFYKNEQSGTGTIGYLYNNDGTGQFSLVSSSIAGDISNSVISPQGGGWIDYDNDGDMDLTIITCCTTFPNGASLANIIFENNVGHNNNFSKIYLEGVQSNKKGIGAELQLKATINGDSYWQTRRINGGVESFGMQEEQMAHFGLGDATIIDSLIVKWPSGALDMCANLPVGSIKMTEGSCIPTLLSVEEYSFQNRNISIHPNPYENSGYMHIKSALSNRIQNIKISNIQGKIINNKTQFVMQSEGKYIVDPDKLNSGVYFLRIEFDDTFFVTKKLVVK
ncbi:FG-GAP-like repeat-containing protein [Lacinutrix chionoecetis]